MNRKTIREALALAKKLGLPDADISFAHSVCDRHARICWHGGNCRTHMHERLASVLGAPKVECVPSRDDPHRVTATWVAGNVEICSYPWPRTESVPCEHATPVVTA